MRLTLVRWFKVVPYVSQRVVYELSIPKKDFPLLKEVVLQPRQVSYVSNTQDSTVLVEDKSSLRQLCEPQSIIDKQGKAIYDLSRGYEKYNFKILNRDIPKLDDILQTVQHIETQNKSRTDHDFITSRGVLMDIGMSRYNRDSYTVNIACIDGQIVMSSDNYRDEVITDIEHLKSIFCGFKFESIMTSGSDEEIWDNSVSFKTVVEMELGRNSIIMGAEVDACLQNYELELSNYVELKVMKNGVKNFQIVRKLYGAILQSYLIGTPSIIIGKRDLQYQMTKVSKIDVMKAMKSHIYKGNQYNIQKTLQWLKIALNWLKNTIDLDETKLWQLVRTKRQPDLIKLIEYKDINTVNQIRLMTIGKKFNSFRKFKQNVLKFQ